MVPIWVTAVIGLLTAVIGAIAGPSIPLIARRFQSNVKAREALRGELEMLKAMDSSPVAFQGRDRLVRLIEERLLLYLGRKHTGMHETL